MATPTPLITKADFAPYIELAQNLSDLKLNPRILEAQNFDLRPLFGDPMWFDLIANIENAPYLDLINGGEYVVDGVTYSFDGIKPILVYFSAARLIQQMDMHITPNAVMQKRNEFSDHEDRKMIALKITDYQNLAKAYWSNMQSFIDFSGKAVYPLYIGFKSCGGNTGSFAPRIFGISGRDTQDQYYRYGSR